jgi:hypothetical protein
MKSFVAKDGSGDPPSPGRNGERHFHGEQRSNVGLSLGPDLCSVLESKKAYDALRTAFYGSPHPVATPNKLITVVVES